MKNIIKDEIISLAKELYVSGYKVGRTENEDRFAARDAIFAAEAFLLVADSAMFDEHGVQVP